MSGRKLKKKNDNAPPKDPRFGQLWYDVVTRTMRKWDGASWATEVKPGDTATARAKASPIARLIERFGREHPYKVSVPSDQVQIRKMSRHGMRFEFVDRKGISILFEMHDVLCTPCEIDELLAARALAIEISGQAFRQQHGERLIIISVAKEIEQ